MSEPSHILQLETDQRVCELPPGTDLLDVGFVKVEFGKGTLPCVACSVVLDEMGKALDAEWEARKK